jgi:hypothetical protein
MTAAAVSRSGSPAVVVDLGEQRFVKLLQGIVELTHIVAVRIFEGPYSAEEKQRLRPTGTIKYSMTIVYPGTQLQFDYANDSPIPPREQGLPDTHRAVNALSKEMRDKDYAILEKVLIK